MAKYKFTSESVSEGHPDKVADQISDSLLDNFLAQSEYSHVALETLVTTGQVVVAGEVTSSAYVNVQKVVRDTIAKIGYTKGEYMFDANSCGVLTAIHEQSADIFRGVGVARDVETQGAGDQGIIFGYACNETNNFMPLSLELSHLIVKALADIRKEGKVMTYLRPDAKSQVTVDYEDGKVVGIDTIVVSTQHDEFIEAKEGFDADAAMVAVICDDIEKYVFKRIADEHPEYAEMLLVHPYKLLVNPTGKFVIGGPAGDTGLTNRKIIVDSYGGHALHGGGGYSGKDSSKVDRSAAYMARYAAKNLVAAGYCEKCDIQVAYAIGKAEPVSLYVNTHGTHDSHLTDEKITEIVGEVFDFRPASIVKLFNMNKPIYAETAAYGHFGRKCETVQKNFVDEKGEPFGVLVELFPWEKTDKVDVLKKKLHGINLAASI